MTVTYIGAINCDQFCDLLSKIENSKGYIYKDSAINAFTIYQGTKDNSQKTENFVPLSFWEIIHFSRSYKRDLQKNSQKASSMATYINLMCDKYDQKLRNKSYFSQMCVRILDLAKNFFSGYGLVSTFSLGKQFYRDLSSIKNNADNLSPDVEQQPQQTSLDSLHSHIFSTTQTQAKENTTSIAQAAIAETSEKNLSCRGPTINVVSQSQEPVNLRIFSTIETQPQAKTTSVATTAASKKSHANINFSQPTINIRPQSAPLEKRPSIRTAELRKKFISQPVEYKPFVPTGQKSTESGACFKAYRKNKETTQDLQTIFRNIAHIEGEAISSLEGTIKKICESNKIDFNNELCIKVISDVFKICEKEPCNRTVDWLKVQNPPLNLIKESLNKLTAKGNSDQTISEYALIELLFLYKNFMQKTENTLSNFENEKLLSANINDPIFVSAVALLLKLVPNDRRIDGFLKSLLVWDISLHTFEKWLKVFTDKKKIHAEAINLSYSAEDILLEAYKIHS